MNFREVSQPQHVNTFTIGVCSSSRLLTQFHKFCTQRAEAHLAGATQRTLLYEGGIRDLGNYGLRDLNSPLSASVVRKNLCAAIADCVLLWRKKSLRSKQGLRLCSLRRIIGTAMPVRGVERKTMANSFDDWLLKNYTNFVEQNDDSSARNKKPLTVDKIY